MRNILEEHLWYALDENKNPYPCDAMTASKSMEKVTHVRFNNIKKYNVKISTVFLPINHSYSIYPNARPVVFETMIFWNKNEELDQYQERYCTWQEALEGHRNAIRLVIRSIRENKNDILDIS